MAVKHVIVVAMAAAMLAYYFHCPLPDAITDQWRLKLFIASFRVANQIADWGDKLGLDTNINITRRVFASAFKMTSYPVSDHGLKITEKVISGVPSRIYRPNDMLDGERLPAVIYYHGGGLVVFSVDTYDNILRQIAKDARAVVIAMNYRLAPEHPFPAPLNDCVYVTHHVIQHASEYSIDVRRIALAGDSAGGLLAPAVALNLAVEHPDMPQPKLQVLLYPMLQVFDFQLPSYIVMDGPTHEIMRRAPIAALWYMYCTGKPPLKLPGILANNHTSKVAKKSKHAQYVSIDLLDDKYKLVKHRKPQSMQFDPDLADFEACAIDPFFSPLMAPDFSLFPTSYVMTAEYDVLRDEGIMFVSRLKEACVEFYHNHVWNGWHGIASYTRTDSGQKALHDVIDFLILHL